MNSPVNAFKSQKMRISSRRISNWLKKGFHYLLFEERHSEGRPDDGRVPGTVIETVAAKLEAAQRNLAEVQSKLEIGDTMARQGAPWGSVFIDFDVLHVLWVWLFDCCVSFRSCLFVRFQTSNRK